MNSLRIKQQKEVLDYDNNINRQILDKVKRQISNYSENVKERVDDVTTEALVENISMKLNSILKKKIFNLETLFLQKGSVAPNVREEVLNYILNNGDVLELFNRLVEIRKDPKLERRAREVMDRFIYGLEPAVNALVYGFENYAYKAIDIPVVSVRLPVIINTLGFYKYIQEMFLTRNLQTITDDSFNAYYDSFIPTLEMELRDAYNVSDIKGFSTSNLYKNYLKRKETIELESGKKMSKAEDTNLKQSIFGLREYTPIVAPSDMKEPTSKGVQTEAQDEFFEAASPPPTFEAELPEPPEEFRDKEQFGDTLPERQVYGRPIPLTEDEGAVAAPAAAPAFQYTNFGDDFELTPAQKKAEKKRKKKEAEAIKARTEGAEAADFEAVRQQQPQRQTKEKGKIII